MSSRHPSRRPEASEPDAQDRDETAGRARREGSSRRRRSSREHPDARASGGGDRADRAERRSRGSSGDRPRRTQAERTAETTERILDATVTSLADLGYGATTTTEICRRAAVSRGALLHHYRTRDELLAAAVTHVARRSIDEFRARLGDVPEGPDRGDVAIDALWQIFRSPTFDAWLELIVAGRTDRGLQRHVARETEALAAAVVDVWVELFSPEDDELAAAPLLLFSLLEGLALNRHTGATLIEDGTPLVLATVKTLGRELLRPTDPSTGGAP